MTAFVIARNELRRIFLSPLAWAVLAAVQFIMAIFFGLFLNDYLKNSEYAGQSSGLADYMGGGLFGSSTIVLLLVVPVMTMRLFAEERRSGSLTLLLSSPASLTDIVLGKFLGFACFMGILLGMIALMPLSLMLGTDLDLARIGAGLVGLLLLSLSFGAVGILVSSLTREPTLAAVISFILVLAIWLLQVPAQGDGAFATVLGYLSLISHFENMRRGIFDTSDVSYYVLFTALFLWFTVQRLDVERN